MTHIDLPPPNLREILNRLRSGDILTHCFRPFPNAPLVGGRIRQEALLARERGVIFDIGHGMGSLCFATARGMMEQGFLPDVISSDVHTLCIDGPAYDLLVTLSKFLAMGMPLGDLVERATLRPARAVRRSELGVLQSGGLGDATVLANGRVLWSRWDHAPGKDAMHLYSANPDGTDLELYYGANSHMTGTNNTVIEFVQPRQMQDGRIMALMRQYTGVDFGGNLVIIDGTHFVENTQPLLANAALAGPAQTPGTPNDVRTIPGPSPGGRFDAGSSRAACSEIARA